MFGKKTKGLVYVSAKYLIYYGLKQEEGITLDFPAKVVEKTEIIDQPAFDGLLLDFVSAKNLEPQQIVMVLGNDIIFEKTVPRSQYDLKSQEETDTFLKAVQIKPEQIDFKVLKATDDVHFVATSQPFYQNIKKTFEKLGWTVDMIIPVSLFSGMAQNDRLTIAEANLVFNSYDLLHVGDFLDGKTQENTKDEPEVSQATPKSFIAPPEKKGSPLKMIIIFILIFAAIFGLTFAGLKYQSQIMGIFGGEAKQEVTPTPISPSSTPTPTPELIPQEDLTINVQNGSGIAGQAGVVQSALEDLGFSNIETGNSDDQEQTTTTVEYSNQVSEEDQELINEYLEETFSDVSIKQDQDTESFNIIIITGESL